MHAYLLVGNDKGKLKKKARAFAKERGEILEFSINKIDDVRRLTRFIKLKLNKPTSILIENIHDASGEALNAFLKNLEESQEEITYILTASSEYGVIPTIASRCQLIKTGQTYNKVNKQSLKFLGMKKKQKIKVASKIRKREEAKRFMENLILALHANLHTNPKDRLKTAKNIKNAQETLTAINMNANIQLQLTKFIAST